MATLITVHDYQTIDAKFDELTLNADFISEVRPVETAFNLLNESSSYIQQLSKAAQRIGIRTVVYDTTGKCLGLLKETSAQLKSIIKNAEQADAKLLALAATDEKLNRFLNN